MRVASMKKDTGGSSRPLPPLRWAWPWVPPARTLRRGRGAHERQPPQHPLRHFGEPGGAPSDPPNLAFALGVIIFLVISALGFALPLPIGVVGHEGSIVLVCLNGLRLLAHRDSLTKNQSVEKM
jgi:hypothetical protein